MALVVLMALANLRGVRESGRIFAAPTYLFVLMCGALIVVGFVRWAMGDLHPVASMVPAQRALTWFLVLRAFAGGCAAMTGTEAIANAVPDFRPPESRTPRRRWPSWRVCWASSSWESPRWLRSSAIIPKDTDTVLSQVGRAVLGDGGFFYYVLQIATMAILILGANTSYAGFPRLSSVMARDGLMPRQFANRGDRLVYSNGIIGLTVVAVIIVWVFEADVSRMVPFYALGVFVGFTLSQAGMVVHWRRLQDPRMATPGGDERVRRGDHRPGRRGPARRPGSSTAPTSWSARCRCWCCSSTGCGPTIGRWPRCWSRRVTWTSSS